jgi:von Willebrand factor type D domain
MRQFKFLAVAITAFLGVVLGEGLVKRTVALIMCGALSFNSTACYSYFWNMGEVANAHIPRVRQQNQELVEETQPLPSPNRNNNQSSPKPANIQPQINSTIPKKPQNNGKVAQIIGINRWWATAGTGILSPTLTIKVKEVRSFFLDIDIEHLRTQKWDLMGDATVSIYLGDKLINKPTDFDSKGVARLGRIEPGIYKLVINGFQVPNNPSIEKIDFQIKKVLTGFVIGPTVAELSTLFVADQKAPIEPQSSIPLKQEELDNIIKRYVPILHFDTRSASEYPEKKNLTAEPYQIPLNAKQTTWQEAVSLFKNGQFRSGDRNDAIRLWKNIQYLGSPTIYASVVQKSTNLKQLAINYYFHYSYSNWQDYGGHNNHEGDWEGVTVFLEFSEDDRKFHPKEIAFAQHVAVSLGISKGLASKGVQKISWESYQEKSGSRPMVWVGLGGHASYPKAGCSSWETGDEHHEGGKQLSEARIIYLPPLGNAITTEWSIDQQWAWLLYPGTWGNPQTCKAKFGGCDVPRGPVFLDTDVKNFYESAGRGERWIDPWKWASSYTSEDKPKCEKKKEPSNRSGKLIAGAKSYGDPHIVTFDGHRYSFQTVGEFILAKSTDGVFEVETRQSPVNRSLSLNSAVAMRVGNDRVAFYSKDFPDSDTSTPLRINGKPTIVQDKSLSLPGGGSIQKQNYGNYVVQWATGEKVAVTIYSRGQFKYMDVFPFVFESQANQMVGLLGNVNGKEDDDLRFRSGDILPSKSTYGNLSQLIQRISPIRLPLGQLEKMYFDQLNKDFGNSWRVTPKESLFDYKEGQSTKSFTDKAFPDAYLTLDMLSPDQLQSARSQCVNAGVQANLLEGCVFDVGFTGYSEFAARTAQVSNILDIVESVIPGFKNPIPEIIRRLPKIPGLPF